MLRKVSGEAPGRRYRHRQRISDFPAQIPALASYSFNEMPWRLVTKLSQVGISADSSITGLSQKDALTVEESIQKSRGISAR
jgi:hypothetical protein